jgi:hypothetical protein
LQECFRLGAAPEAGTEIVLAWFNATRYFIGRKRSWTWIAHERFYSMGVGAVARYLSHRLVHHPSNARLLDQEERCYT